MVLYGQMVIGAPGAGKTTYCDGMRQYLSLLGRECHVVNLDPANEVPHLPTNGDGDGDGEDGDNGHEEEGDEDDEDSPNSQLPYEAILDVSRDVISLDKVMSELHLGPNGGLMYCMEYIERHLGEVMRLLKERLGMAQKDINQQSSSSSSSRAYLLFDLPGQVELTAHSDVISRIARRLTREMDLRLVCVQLVDAAVCLPDASKFIGATMVCTASMMRLELPCVNVLSKMDLLQSTSGLGSGGGTGGKGDDGDSDGDYGYDDDDGASPSLPFNLEYFTQCHDLRRLVDYLDSNPMDVATAAHHRGGKVDEFDYMEDPEYIEARHQTRSSIFSRKYGKLNAELCDVVEDYGLLSFLPLSIQDAESVGRVVARVDKCNGYVFLKQQGGGSGDGGTGNGDMQDMFSSAMVADSEWAAGVLSDVQEKYMGRTMFQENIAELDGDRHGRIREEQDGNEAIT